MKVKKERAGRTTARQTGGLRQAPPPQQAVAQNWFLTRVARNPRTRPDMQPVCQRFPSGGSPQKHLAAGVIAVNTSSGL
jgi:hypothetical protein